MLSLWKRLPVLIRAVITGLLVAAAGTTPWALLVWANTKYWPQVPWAVPPTALYLWFFWKYVRGEGWPRSTSEARRAGCRANNLTGEVLGAALFAGVLGLTALVLFSSLTNRLVRLPSHPPEDLSRFPILTLASLLITSALVAGVAEESAFRGYMQGPIERRHGPLVAILVTGGLFGFAHFTHPEVGLILLPYYVAVAAVYGTLAYLTNSILPSLILHAGGNVLGSLQEFAGGRTEWQSSRTPDPLIWQSGTDASFWLSCLGTAVAVTAALFAYRSLARIARDSQTPETAEG